MSVDISANGLRLNIRASVTFPVGFSVTQLSDDTDGVDVPSQQLADKAMGVNGDLLTWARAVALDLGVSVVPGSVDDQNLAILADANRVGGKKRSAKDVITLTVFYPDGEVVTFSGGRITDAPPARSATSAGRIKTNVYRFAFEQVTKAA